MSSPWPVPTGPPLLTEDGLVPAAVEADVGHGSHESESDIGEQTRMAWLARVVAAVVGVVVCAVPLVALGVETFEFEVTLPRGVEASTGASDGLVWFVALSISLVSVPCFYIAGSNDWRRRPRWMRALMAWLGAVTSFVIVAFLELRVITPDDPAAELRGLDATVVDDAVRLILLSAVPAGWSLLVVLAVVELFGPGRGASEARAR